MNGLHHFITPIDWGVVAGYLLVTTLLGYGLRGKHTDIRNFFHGGRSLPWLVVAGSLIATEISAVTFLGVVGSVLALGGDLTYLQWVAGSIFARIIVGVFFVKGFYEKDVFSPYDFIGNRLGSGMKKLTTVLFTVGCILAQSVRVLIVALPLKVITPLPFAWCIVGVSVIAVAWVLMGGIRTVIWTDLIWVVIFWAGGLTGLFWIVGTFESGWNTLFAEAGAVELFDGSTIDKLRVFNFSTSTELQFTFWVAIFAVPFLNLSLYGVDHTNAQRIFCCRDSRDAKKAVLWSIAGSLVTFLMLMVGTALFVFYLKNPPTDPLILQALEWSGGQAGAPGMVFPVWVITEMPPGVRGLVLAGFFGIAISCLASGLAALGQTTFSMLRRSESQSLEVKEDSPIRIHRFIVVFWGIVMMGFILVLFSMEEKTDMSIRPLILGLMIYTGGPLLGIFLVALLRGRRGNVKGLIVGTGLSFIVIFWVQHAGWTMDVSDSQAIGLDLLPASEELAGPFGTNKSRMASEWMWPISTLMTMALGCFPNWRKA